MKSILLTALLLFSAVGAFAQEKTLSQAEFQTVIKNAKWALTEWKGKAVRMTQTSEAKAEGKIQQFSTGKTVIEFASPTVSHLITEITSSSKNTKSESIRIGDKTYKRTDNGAWIEGTIEAKAAEPPPPPPAVLPGDKPAEKTTEYKHLGTEQFNGLTANVYLATTKIKRVNPATNQETLATSTQKYWFNEADGVKLKEESVNETRGGETNFSNRLTVIWELDPTIKVAAPAIN